MFHEILQRWISLQAHSWAPKRLYNVRHAAEGWCRILGSRPLREIRADEIEAAYRSRDDGQRSGAWLNLERQAIRAFWRWARERGFAAPDQKPELAWPRKREVHRRPCILISPDEERRFLAVLPLNLSRFVGFALATGLRVGEIRALRWGWISEDWVLSIPAEARKQRRELRVPLSEKAIAALGTRGFPGDSVFHDLPRSADGLNRPLKRWARKAGLDPRISPHQFRKTWVSRLRRSGVPLEAVKQLGGWASIVVLTQHYWAALDEGEARAYLARI